MTTKTLNQGNRLKEQMAQSQLFKQQAKKAIDDINTHLASEDLKEMHTAIQDIITESAAVTFNAAQKEFKNL